MQKLIIAIVDNKAKDFVGNGLVLHNNNVTAVRMFEDVIRMENSNIGRHIEDHDLVCLGILDTDTMTIEPEPQTIMTGKLWLEYQNSKPQETK